MVPLNIRPAKLLNGTPNQNHHPGYDHNHIITAIGSKMRSTSTNPTHHANHIFHQRQKIFFA